MCAHNDDAQVSHSRFFGWLFVRNLIFSFATQNVMYLCYILLWVTDDAFYLCHNMP